MNWHKESICSIQWNPLDDWTLAVGSIDNTVSIWDFSVESDQNQNNEKIEVPEQLLFIH